MGNLLTDTQNFVRNKYSTIEECKKVVDLDTLKGLTELQLSHIIDLFHEDVDNDNPFSEFLERGWNMLRHLESYDSKVNLVKEVIAASFDYFKIKEFDYELYVKLISYLVYRELKGGK